jgi:hypothetical protein
MNLQEAKRIIRKLIGGWSDQKLAAVYAFNQDGKMSFFHACNCLVGVHSSEVLHTGFCGGQHYNEAVRGMRFEEFAYLILGGTADRTVAIKEWGPEVAARMERLRNVRLSAILRAEMRLRARKPVFLPMPALEYAVCR